ncbi:MAG: vitamin K epoxide reductase family protein [Gemmatimonadales bacterium]
MNRRLAIAVLALVGIFIASYLHLFKLGMIGTIACGTGSCDTVQLSPQSVFLGVDVALIGVLGYIALLGLAMLSLHPKFAGASWPVTGLVVLSAGAVVFTAYLKYLEFFVIGAVCRWCVGSAVIIALLFILAVLEWREGRLPQHESA